MKVEEEKERTRIRGQGTEKRQNMKTRETMT